jgi:hypothetical protein
VTEFLQDFHRDFDQKLRAGTDEPRPKVAAARYQPGVLGNESRHLASDFAA